MAWQSSGVNNTEMVDKLTREFSFLMIAWPDFCSALSVLFHYATYIVCSEETAIYSGYVSSFPFANCAPPSGFGIISSEHVENGFRRVDRKFFVPRVRTDTASYDNIFHFQLSQSAAFSSSSDVYREMNLWLIPISP